MDTSVPTGQEAIHQNNAWKRKCIHCLYLHFCILEIGEAWKKVVKKIVRKMHLSLSLEEQQLRIESYRVHYFLL